MLQLKNSSLLNKLFILIGLAIVSGCANSTPSDELLSKIKKELNEGKTVIVYQMVNKDKTTEQYADWSAYLNDFSASKSKTYNFHETNKTLNAKLSKKQANISDSYTLFLKKGKSSYFYDGVILEAMVYMAVENSYANKTLSPMDQAFLPDEIAIDLAN